MRLCYFFNIINKPDQQDLSADRTFRLELAELCSGEDTDMKIGTTIRDYRLQKGLSQGDIEKRTGLLRCYLSRVENGHTVPSLDTLTKIAQALELPLAQFFSDGAGRSGAVPRVSDEELRFLTQIRRYSPSLNESDRKLLLAMVRKFASTAGASASATV